MDPDSPHHEADARRLFEGMLQALSDVRRGGGVGGGGVHLFYWTSSTADGKTHVKLHHKDTAGGFVYPYEGE